jgi:hypothetical protein
LRVQWYELADRLNHVVLSGGWGQDMAIWKWPPSKKFTVKSVYAKLTKNDAGPSFERIWKSKIPKKIKCFMWLVEQDAILTKGNLIRRKWQGILNVICVMMESLLITYFFRCPMARVTWGIISL